jgi:hypothetical protein
VSTVLKTENLTSRIMDTSNGHNHTFRSLGHILYYRTMAETIRPAWLWCLFLSSFLLVKSNGFHPWVQRSGNSASGDDTTAWNPLHHDTYPQSFRSTPPGARQLQLQHNASSCSLCSDRIPVDFPDKNLSAYGLGTCDEVDASAQAEYTEGSAECEAVRFFSGICGCPPIENSCSLCSAQGGKSPIPDYVVQSLQQFGLPPMSCEDMTLFVTQYSPEDIACDLMFLSIYLCECDDLTNKKVINLIWILRCAGILSGLGSFFIVVDVLRQLYRSNSLSVYSELILTMSTFDIMSSIAWTFGPAAVPSENDYGEPYMAALVPLGGNGSEATCKVSQVCTPQSQ